MPTSIRWLGHSFFSIGTPGGKRVLIDPWVEGPTCPVKLEDLAADAVLVTHDHFDHAGQAVDISRRTGATVAALPETADKFKGEGLAEGNIVFGGFGMNIGGHVTVAGVEVTMTQAFHSSATAGPCGYILKLEDGTTLYHSGDTGIFESMRLLGELYPLDVALLPIGGCFTMDSFQAAQALKLLRPKAVIPMHYQSFPILEQDASRFVSLAQREAPQVKVVVLEPGQEYQV